MNDVLRLGIGDELDVDEVAGTQNERWFSPAPDHDVVNGGARLEDITGAKFRIDLHARSGFSRQLSRRRILTPAE